MIVDPPGGFSSMRKMNRVTQVTEHNKWNIDKEAIRKQIMLLFIKLIVKSFNAKITRSYLMPPTREGFYEDAC